MILERARFGGRSIFDRFAVVRIQGICIGRRPENQSGNDRCAGIRAVSEFVPDVPVTRTARPFAALAYFTIRMTDSIYVIAVLSGLLALSEWLVRKTILRHAGTAILVILITAVAANTGILPAGSTSENPVPVYDFIFSTIAPLAIFLLLLPVNLSDILKAGAPMIGFYFAGSAATAIGVVLAMWIVNGPETIGPLYNAVGGMFVGTYTGGSVNFNTLALHFDVARDGVLYTGAVVVDSIMTTVWMLVTLAIPRVFAKVWPVKRGQERKELGEVTLGIEADTETMHPMDMSILLGLGFGAVWLSNLLATYVEPVPAPIILTIMALILAQVPAVARLKGIRLVGMFAVYMFLAVIGAFCDLGAAVNMGALGVTMMKFTALTVLIHGVIIYGLALLLKFDPVIVSLASQANIGGGTSALALARSLGREDLVLPSILIGSLGYAVGTFLGFWVAEYWLLFLV